MKTFIVMRWRELSFLPLSIVIGLNLYLYSCNETIKDGITEKKVMNMRNQRQLKNIAELKNISHRLALPADRLTLSQNLKKIVQELEIQEVKFDISPEETLRGQSGFTRSKVSLKVQNVTDTPLYALVSHIMGKFPGIINPLEFKLEKEGSVIKGSFKYEWVKKIK